MDYCISDYFFFGALCDSALAAAVLLFLPELGLRSTFDAAFPALELVFLWFAINFQLFIKFSNYGILLLVDVDW